MKTPSLKVQRSRGRLTDKQRLGFTMLALLILLPLFQTTVTAQAKKSPYSSIVTLATGLQTPIVWTTDLSGKVFLTQTDGITTSIDQYDPETKTISVLTTENLWVDSLSLDCKGNIYYTISPSDQGDGPSGSGPSEIRELTKTSSGYSAASTVLYSTDDYIYPMAIAGTGDIYFVTLTAETQNSNLYRISANDGALTLLLSPPFRINTLSIPRLSPCDPNIYFSSRVFLEGESYVIGVYKFDQNTLTLSVLEKKPAEDPNNESFTFPSFSYMAVGVKGDIYTYYRERSRYYLQGTGLLEINHFSPSAVRLNKSPTEIVSTSYNRRVMVAARIGMVVTLTGDLIYTLMLDDGSVVPPGQPIIVEQSLIWYNPRDGKFKTLTTSPWEAGSWGLTLTLDQAGNLYYTDGSSSLFRLDA